MQILTFSVSLSGRMWAQDSGFINQIYGDRMKESEVLRNWCSGGCSKLEFVGGNTAYNANSRFQDGGIFIKKSSWSNQPVSCFSDDN